LGQASDTNFDEMTTSSGVVERSAGNSERANNSSDCMPDERPGGAAKEKIEDIRIFEEWLRSSNATISISYRLHQGTKLHTRQHQGMKQYIGKIFLKPAMHMQQRIG
jgi:hypothetical protein